MTQPADFSFGFEAHGDCSVQYGAYRLAIAEWADVDPADVGPHQVAMFEIAYEEENEMTWAYAHRADEEGRQP